MTVDPSSGDPFAPTHPIPQPQGDSEWRSLSQADKRARVIRIAGELFAREGVEFPMPALAKEVGVGVGSLYRQVGTKDDVLAELVLERLATFRTLYEGAVGAADPTAALLEVIEATLAETMKDRVAKISFDLSLDRDDVRESRAQAAAVLAQLVDAAKAQGGIRPDAEVMDLRIMFRLAREAEKITPGGGRRIADLVIAGLQST